MSDYKYYAFDFAIGTTREIFRSNVDTPRDFGTRGLWRAKKDGSWSDGAAELRPLLNCWMQGDFDLDEDEITEEQANSYLNQWRASGSWPGRE
jgi:hypothetical protein